MMIGTLKLVAALVCGLTAPEVVFACSLAPPPLFRIDRPISIAADGSFENASVADNINGFGGEPIVDVGHGRIGQRLYESYGCSSSETLLFVDCNTLEMILVNGVYSEKNSVGGGTADSITDIQYPVGPIRLSRMTVSDVATVAMAHGYNFTVDVKGVLAKMRKKNRYDPFMGCKIFYPDSDAAKS